MTDSIQPKGRPFVDTGHDDTRLQKRDKRFLKPYIAKSFHPTLQNIRPRADRSTGGRPAERGIESQSRVTDLESFRAFQQRPDHPDDYYELDISWKGLLKAIPGAGEFGPGEIARQDLQNITLITEAYIRTPLGESLKVDIWGNQSQCVQAKKQLRAWEQHLRSTGSRPSQKTWHKTPAYDGRREDRKRHEYFQDLTDQAIYELDDSHFGFEAYLVWPEDYDLKTYLAKYDSEVLSDVSRSFYCRFHHQNTALPRYTKIQAQSENSLLAAYQRLINLVKEMMTQKYRGTHGNFFRLPSVEGYRDRISVDQDTSSKEFCAHLVGGELLQHEWEQWSVLMKNMDKLNRKEIMSSIDSLLKSLHLSQSHVRLRIDFGNLRLRSFTKPKDGYATYLTDDFLRMIQNSRTELSDPVLCGGQQDLSQFADRLSTTGQFHQQKQTYRQLFDFQGTDSTKRLRLEIELEPGYDVGEAQECAHRWLNFKAYGNSTENILGLKMFDLEKPGYMFRVNAFALDTNEGIAKDLETFKSTVTFEPSQGSYPRLQSSFPKHPKLLAVTEITAINYQFKDTDGTIELRREDIYMQRSGQASRLPNTTRLALSYYYRDWDNLFGEFSNKKPGEDVDWHRGLATFFPDVIDPDRPRSLPRTFKGFMKELHEIQTLLKDVLGETSPADTTAEQ